MKLDIEKSFSREHIRIYLGVAFNIIRSAVHQKHFMKSWSDLSDHLCTTWLSTIVVKRDLSMTSIYHFWAFNNA